MDAFALDAQLLQDYLDGKTLQSNTSKGQVPLPRILYLHKNRREEKGGKGGEFNCVATPRFGWHVFPDMGLSEPNAQESVVVQMLWKSLVAISNQTWIHGGGLLYHPSEAHLPHE